MDISTNFDLPFKTTVNVSDDLAKFLSGLAIVGVDIGLDEVTKGWVICITWDVPKKAPPSVGGMCRSLQ